MPDYELTVAILGKDKASGIFGGLTKTLGRMGQIAGGIVGARIFMGLMDQVTGVATAAIQATAAFQMMQVGLEGLVARELVQLSGGLLKVADVLPQAQEQAKGLMNELARMSILSPYTVEATMNMFRLNMAFGFTSEQAKMMTSALLNMAAGIGASNEQAERMAYNLAQVRIQGKVTALDVRQLALAGLDLNSALRYIGDQLGLNIETYKDFNKYLADGSISWEQFTELFAKYAEENFGGAAERMSRTLIGLKSTFHDVWVLTVPQIMLKAAEAVTETLGKILDIFLTVRDSGILESIGDRWEAATRKFLEPINKVLDFILGYIRLQSTIKGLMAGMGSKATEKALTTMQQQLKNLIPQGSILKQVIYNIWGDRGLMALKIFTRAVNFLRQVFHQVRAAVVFLFNSLMYIITANKEGFIKLGGAIQDAFNQLDLNKAGSTIGSFAIKARDWIATVLLPKILELATAFVQWLPGAIQTTVEFWNTRLHPALIRFSNFVKTEVVPRIQDIVKWLKEHLPPAIETASKFVTGTLKPAFKDFSDWWQENWPKISALFKRVWDENIKPRLDKLATFIKETLMPALKTLSPMFEKAFQWIVDNPDKVSKFIAIFLGLSGALKTLSFLAPLAGPLFKVAQFITGLGISAATAGGGITGAITTLVTAVGPFVSALLPVIAIIGAVVAAVVGMWLAFSTNFGGIRDFMAQFVANLAPIIEPLKAYFAIAIPNALTTLKLIWDNTIGPLLQGFAWLLSNVIFPAVLTLERLFVTVLVGAITTLTGVWTGTFKPALETVWGWISENIVPIFEKIGELLHVVFDYGGRVAAAVWENRIAPALETVWKWVVDLWTEIKEELQPVFDSLNKFWKETLGPQLKTVYDDVLVPLRDIWSAIEGAISSLLGWLDTLIEKFKNMKIPEWATRKSPSPIEQTFMGLNKELRTLANTNLPTLKWSFASITPPKLEGTINGRQESQKYITIPVTIQNVSSEIDVEKLFYTIAARLRSANHG